MKRRSVSALVGVALCGVLVVALPRSSSAEPLVLLADSLALQGQTPSSVVYLPANWGGDVLDIQGSTSDTSPPLVVTVGSASCAAPPTLTLDSADPTTSAVGFRIACVLPVLPTGTLAVTVSLAGQTATSADVVVVPPAPTVAAVAGCVDAADGTTGMCPDAGGTILRLSGQLPPAGDWDPLIGGHVCSVVSQTYSAEASCILPPGADTQPLTIAWAGGPPVATGLTVGYAGPAPLAAPADITATPGAAQATVSWSTASDSTATAYRVTPATASGPLPAVTFAVPADGAPATMTGVVGGLANGTPVTFTVAAMDGTQVGTESAPSTAVVPSATPGAPTGLVARAQRPGPGHQHAGSTVLLSWVAPTSDGGSPVITYAVMPFLDGVAQPSVTATGTSTTMTIQGGTYVFEVTARNAVGSGPASAPSAPLSIPGPAAKH